MYSNLRFVISAALVGCAGLIAVLALLPATFEERLLASEEVSAPPCKEHWLQLDPNCLSRRGMPWVADAPAANTVPTAAKRAPEQAVSESLASAGAAERRAIEATAPSQDAPVPPVVAEEPTPATQRSDITAPPAPQREASTPPVATEPPPPFTAERHIPKHSEPSRHAAPAAPQLQEKRHVARPAAADTRACSEENSARGSWRETDRRGAERRAQVSRQSARHPRELLCGRRDAAHNRDPADLNSGRLLLFRPALARR